MTCFIFVEMFIENTVVFRILLKEGGKVTFEYEGKLILDSFTSWLSVDTDIWLWSPVLN